ncbi:MAG: ABC transporter substrate-binding protein [Acidimicrobiia bacterium]
MTALAAAAASPGAGIAAPSVQGFDGSTIKIGGIGIFSSFADGDVGARARFQRFNDDKEIKGIKIEYTEWLDEKLDPTLALSAARQLVEQDGVFAIIPSFSAVMPGDYLTQKKVPWFGWAFDATYCTTSPSETSYGFGYNGCLVPDDPKRMPDNGGQLYKYVSEQSGNKKPTIAIFANDSDSGSRATATQASAYSGAGFDVVLAKGLLPPPPIGDVTPYVQELITSADGGPPDAMVCLLILDCIEIWNQLKANSYEGTFQSPLYSDLLIEPMEGSVASVTYVPADVGTPAQEQMAADFAAFADDAVINSGTSASYFAADMFITTLKQLKKKKIDITPENVQKAASKLTFEVKGLYGPTSFPDSFVRPTPSCVAIALDNGTAWETVEPYICSSKTYKVKKKFFEGS